MKNYLIILTAMTFLVTGCQQQQEADKDKAADDPRMAGITALFWGGVCVIDIPACA